MNDTFINQAKGLKVMIHLSIVDLRDSIGQLMESIVLYLRAILYFTGNKQLQKKPDNNARLSL